MDLSLKDIISSSKATKASIDDLTQYLNEDKPEVVKRLIERGHFVEGVSLLNLKNETLLSYINDLILITLSKLEKLENNVDDIEIVKQSIRSRVLFERGIKPLEKKLNYQLDKMIRSYTKMEDDTKEENLNKEQELKSKSDSDADADSDSDSEDEMAYKPDVSALATAKSTDRYKPPKISAMAPPTVSEDKPTKKLQSMEEYLQEQSDMPTVEASIGSTIVDHGKGGVKTTHDKRKEDEIQRYEEDNFIRLPSTQTKKSFKQKQRDLANQFAGEDWSMFNSKDTSKAASRKRKPTTDWDRAKRKRA